MMDQDLYSRMLFKFTSWTNGGNIRRTKINVRIRPNKLQKKIVTWPDSLADDYINPPIDNELDQICFYDMTRCYKKGFNAFQKVHVNDEETNSYIQGGIQTYRFKGTHPGHDTTNADANDIIKKLKARGGRDQLLMFLTGPAGSGKSTAMKIAQQCCYEFCIAVCIMWSDKTFIFTAYTGLAASLFGGVTISKAAFLNQHKQLSVDDKNEWQDVQIVVIDKVSFMSDTILKTLDRKLKKIGNRSQPFGGFTITFANDFRQLEPVGAKDTELLFASLSSQHLENCLNAVNILENVHCFREDPEYGQMLKRMWSGDLTKEDCKRINTRVLGTNGLELPPELEGKHKFDVFQTGTY